MTRVVRSVSLVGVLLVLLAAAGGGVGSGATRGSASAPCPSASSSGSVVGTIANVLHSTVYVGGSFVGVTPFDVASGSFVCTDTAGQAILDLSRSKRSLLCVELESTMLQVTVPSKVAASVVRGSIWCSLQLSAGYVSASIAGVKLRATKRALVGVAVVGKVAVIKVLEGSAFVTPTRAHDGVSSSQQLLVFPTGLMKKSRFLPSSADQVAVARVRLAQPSG
jgi:hypothetical protein